MEGKYINNNEDEFVDWSFPKIDLYQEDNGSNIIQSTKNEEENSNNENDEVINAIYADVDKKLVELEKLKEEVNSQIEILKNITDELVYPLKKIDNEIISLLQELIKKSVKNIVHEKINLDPKFVINIIEGLRDMITEKGGMITVFLSDADFNKLNRDQINKLTLLKIDPTLKEGDVVMKANHAEIRALFDERLDKMIGIKQ